MKEALFKRDYPKLFAEMEEWPEERKRLACQELCKTDMYFLLRYGCKVPDYVMNTPFAVERCKEYDERASSAEGLNRWLIMVFREGYKSTIYNYGAIIQKVLTFPNDSTCIFSYNKSLAKKHLKSIKETLEDSKTLKNWFPDILYENPEGARTQWSLDDGITVKREVKRNEPTVYASGLVTGMPTGMHFNYICYDDVVTRDSVKTPYSTEETTEAFKNANNLGISIPNVRSEKWILGTFYSYGDTYCKMLEDDVYKFDKVPWINTSEEEWYRTAPGEYFVHTVEQAEERKKIQGRYDIATQMLLEPVPAEDRTFKFSAVEENFYSPTEVNLHNLNTYIMVDVGGFRKAKRDHDPDNTAIVVLGKDSFGNEYFIDGVYDIIRRPDSIDKTFDLVRKYNVSYVLWEQVAAQEDETAIKRKMAETGLHFRLETYAPRFDKHDRIVSSLLAAVECGKLRFPAEKGYIREGGKVVDLIYGVLKKEMDEFPRGHDDFLDCLSMRTQLPEYGRIKSKVVSVDPLNRTLRRKPTRKGGIRSYI